MVKGWVLCFAALRAREPEPGTNLVGGWSSLTILKKKDNSYLCSNPEIAVLIHNYVSLSITMEQAVLMVIHVLIHIE